MIKVAERLNHIEEYYFSKKLREVKKLEMDGKPIINMGIGSPDILPPKKISESLEKSLSHKNAHRYQSYKGTDLLRESIKNFYNSTTDFILEHIKINNKVNSTITSFENPLYFLWKENKYHFVPSRGYQRINARRGYF